MEAIAGDAGLQEKSQADLERLGNMLHDGCVRAIEEYEAKQKEDPNFDGVFNFTAFLTLTNDISNSLVLRAWWNPRIFCNWQVCVLPQKKFF